MPFINSKVTVKISEEREKELKSRLGQAISVIPGKSESWLMTGFEDVYDSFTYNMIVEVENYQSGVIATFPLYCFQDTEDGSVGMRMMTWEGEVLLLLPTDKNPLAKFAQ